MFYVKIHDAGYRKIIAVCDMQLIGKNLTNGEIKLDVSERFYKGDLKNKDELINILNSAESINVIGNEAVALCVEIGLVDNENILKFGDVSYALVVEG